MSEFEMGPLRREREGEDEHVEREVLVPADLRYLEGHFPGSPIVPGVAQLVALAEASAREAWPELGACAGVRRVKFMEGLFVGDTLVLSLDRGERGVAFRIHKGGTECTRGTLVFRSA